MAAKGALIGIQAWQCGLDHDGMTARDYAAAVAKAWRAKGKSARTYWRGISVDGEKVHFEVVVVREKRKKGGDRCEDHR